MASRKAVDLREKAEQRRAQRFAERLASDDYVRVESFESSEYWTPISEFVGRERRPANWLVKDWLYRERHHQIYGQSESGKTWIAAKLIADVLKVGGTVVYLDEENGAEFIAEKLTAFGVKAATVEALLRYRWQPRLTKHELATLRKVLEDAQPALVVYDSAGRFFNWAGLKENDNMDAIRWYDNYVLDPCNVVGAASLVIDHDTRRPSVEGARGAGAKQQITDVTYKATRKTRFSRKDVGLVDVQVEKDRHGYLSLGRNVKLGGTPFEFNVSAAQVTMTRVPGSTQLGNANRIAIVEWIRDAGVATTDEVVLHFDRLPKGHGHMAGSTVRNHLAFLSKEGALSAHSEMPEEGGASQLVYAISESE